MTTVKDRNISLAGTTVFHVLLILLLINLRHCAGSGGGGNGGLNGGPYQSIELAGLGNSIDGWGESLEEAAEAPVTTNDAVVDDAAIADNTDAAAPTVSNDKQTTKNPNPKLNSKPAEKTEAQKQQERLNNLMQLGNKAGKGNTTGGGKQGVENGSIDKNGIFNKDGSPGKGGGEGGGEGGGKGGGYGKGVSEYSLGTRGIDTKFIKNRTAPAEGKVVVRIWVNASGVVTKAVADPAKSSAIDARLYDMAVSAAKEAKFESADKIEQTGYITFEFVLGK